MLVKVFHVGMFGAMKVDSCLDGNNQPDPSRSMPQDNPSYFNEAGKPERSLTFWTERKCDTFKVSDWPGAFGGDPVRFTETGVIGFAVTFGRVEVHIELNPVAQNMAQQIGAGAP